MQLPTKPIDSYRDSSLQSIDPRSPVTFNSQYSPSVPFTNRSSSEI